MKYISFLVVMVSFVLVSCSDKNDEPISNEDKLIGYWAITHIQTIEQKEGVHSTTDREVPPHGNDSYATDDNYRFDVLIFDEDFVTVRGSLPNIPQPVDYDMETTDGQIQYLEDYDNWNESLSSSSDQYGWPFGIYKIKNNDLFIGSSNVGTIKFISDNEFTLDYTKTFDNNHYRRSIYTYSRIYSLTL